MTILSRQSYLLWSNKEEQELDPGFVEAVFILKLCIAAVNKAILRRANNPLSSTTTISHLHKTFQNGITVGSGCKSTACTCQLRRPPLVRLKFFIRSGILGSQNKHL